MLEAKRKCRWACRDRARFVLLLAMTSIADAQTKAKEIHVKIDGAQREALVFAPADSGPAPLVFAFHGHGGSAKKTSETFAIQKHWPAAVVVYMQGLPIVGRTDPDDE